MLYLIGLGLAWKDFSLKALEAINSCDEIYLEKYTSLSDFSANKLSKLIGKEVIELNRKEVEEEKLFLKEAHLKKIALLVYGDPLSATTHGEILLEAKKKIRERSSGPRQNRSFGSEIQVEIIHSTSILTAIAEAGLSLYKFGKTASIPFAEKGFEPESFYDVLKENQSIKAHTLFLLDLRPDENKFLTIPEAINSLLKISHKKDKKFTENTLCIGCARLGQESQKIKSGKAEELLKEDWGNAPFCLIVPSELHFIEESII